MIKTHVFTAMMLVAVTTADRAHAHVGSIIYPIYEVPTADLPDIHDESIADWDAVLPDVSLTNNDFIHFDRNGASEPIDPADLAWRLFLAWHNESQRIYMAVERLDDWYEPPPSDGCCPEGSSWLAVDGDHSGGEFEYWSERLYSEEERKRLESVQAQGYWVRPEPWPVGSDGLLGHSGWAKDWVTRPPWADAHGYQQGENPNYSLVELYVSAFDDLHWQGPELSRRSTLEPGKIIGLRVTIHDLDFGSGLNSKQKQYWLAAASFRSQPFGWADNFVDAELIPCSVGDCSGRRTTVQVDSWGRIKASLAPRE